jgi:arylsulfatase A-like enzyme
LGPEGFWPEDQGFDVNKGGSDWGHPPTYFAPYNNPRLKDELPTEYLPYRLARETSRFIEQSRDGPFLAYLSFHVVHTPLMAPEQLVKKYEAKAKNLPSDRTTFGREVRDVQVRLVQDHAVYAGMIRAMDAAVGKVLDTLENAGVADNTVVFFTSDNGGLSTAEGSPTSNVPLRAGKGWLYEGGLRAPLIVRWPGVTKPGSTCNAPVVSPDYYPTILEMAHLPTRPEQHIDGESIVPLLNGKSRARAPIYWHYPHYGNQGGVPGGVVRDGDWKLIRFYETDDVELYNLTEDLSEARNVAATEPERAEKMQGMLHNWLKETGAVMPTQNPKYR